MLSEEQIERFWVDGYTVAENGVTPDQLAALNRQLDQWVEESRRQTASFGETADGRSRFELEPGHTAERPRLGRIANPADLSEAYRETLWTAPLVDMVVDLIGPNLKFHHCKVARGLPGADAPLAYSQSHALDPHTNDDVVVAVVLLTELTAENGPFLASPGSHRERYSLFQGDAYRGEMPSGDTARLHRRAAAVTGRPGTAILHHTWLAHALGPNRTERPRNLLTCDYTAADAFPLTAPALPSRLTGAIVRGEPSRFARLKAGILELPPSNRREPPVQPSRRPAAAE